MEYTPKTSISMEKLMFIGDLSEKSGFSRDTIRWYESRNLINSARSSLSRNAYRVYDEEALAQLRMIKCLKGMGFTLNEIREMQILDQQARINCSSVGEKMASKIRQVDDQIAQLLEVKSRILQLQETCAGDCKEEMMKKGL